MYEIVTPTMRDVVAITPIPDPFGTGQIILENIRKEIYTAHWELSRDLKRKLLLRIGEGPGQFKLTDLGIERGEICF